ncbi:MAG: ATP-binding protein [Elainella sp. Prado103]|jgi:C4-dicarboxylate-specific signal transduction histidine kinase|nr:ATP-binding protein [Elainella sp. Prado103]
MWNQLRAQILLSKLPKASLRQVLVVPFVLQIVGTVGLVGYLSFRNGQQAVNDLANQLIDRSNQLVTQHLDSYLAVPQQINQVNLKAIELGILDVDDFDQMGQYFWQQMQVFPVDYINYANQQGEFIGVERTDENQLLLHETLKTDLIQLSTYTLDAAGNRHLVRVDPEAAEPIQQEGWYVAAAQAQRPVWSDIYQWDDQPDVLSISASYPVANSQRRLIGVIGVDLLLSGISNFLQQIEISPNARVFILEQDGKVVATSTNQPVYHTFNEEVQRLNVLQSQDRLIQAVASQLHQQFGSFSVLQRPRQLTLWIDQERQFVQTMPWQDALGLDWLVVIAVPERDFMTQINQNTRLTLLLSVLAGLLSIAIGILTTRWVLRPILQLNQAARSIAAGQLDQTVPIQTRDELGELAISFNRMAAQLRASFTALANTNQQLEQRVQERTASLHEKNDELTQTLRQLQTAQDELIQSEKMAVLGQLVAGIAHEVNTPLGAIRASISNVTAAVDASLHHLPQLFRLLTPAQLDLFLDLLHEVQQPQAFLSFREERQLRRRLKQELLDRQITPAEPLAASLSKMGIATDLDRWLPLLHLNNNQDILETAYQLSALQSNSQNIVLAVERAAKIVFALKNYARQDSSPMLVEASVVDGIDTILTLYYNQLKQGVEVHKHYFCQPIIPCYPEELTQVWTNLIHNALQAMEYQGSLTITVEQIKQHIVVKISDTGCGIPPDIQSQVFKPFFTTKPIGEGSGLGLDIVQRIVAKHHGSVELESQPGHTTFSVWLPTTQS